MEEQGQEFAARSMASARASGDPLPGPLGDAFASGAIVVAGIAVRKVVAADWVFFKQLNSPIIRMVQEMQQNPEAPEEITFTEEENWELAWQFTHTPAQLREVLAKGREALTAVAVSEIGDNWPTETVKFVGAAVMEQLERQWKTALKHKAEAEEKGEISFFRVAGASQKMASAGGSST